MEQPFQKKRVLLVDDEASLREIYSLELSRQGFEVLLATNGEEGLVAIRKERPDAILLDLQMPVKDGFDVLRELSQDRQLKRIPVVILSNADEETSFKKVGQYETHFYLVKALTTPSKVAKLLREVVR
ncbi:MAG: response regulator [Candidatus Moraniibacteriota bacterium]|nr:MAG: response regulator [Candidatus Moranbacteria bacterium]